MSLIHKSMINLLDITYNEDEKHIDNFLESLEPGKLYEKSISWFVDECEEEKNVNKKDLFKLFLMKYLKVVTLRYAFRSYSIEDEMVNFANDNVLEKYYRSYTFATNKKMSNRLLMFMKDIIDSELSEAEINAKVMKQGSIFKFFKIMQYAEERLNAEIRNPFGVSKASFDNFINLYSISNKYSHKTVHKKDLLKNGENSSKEIIIKLIETYKDFFEFVQNQKIESDIIPSLFLFEEDTQLITAVKILEIISNPIPKGIDRKEYIKLLSSFSVIDDLTLRCKLLNSFSNKYESLSGIIEYRTICNILINSVLLTPVYRNICNNKLAEKMKDKENRTSNLSMDNESYKICTERAINMLAADVEKIKCSDTMFIDFYEVYNTIRHTKSIKEDYFDKYLRSIIPQVVDWLNNNIAINHGNLNDLVESVAIDFIDKIKLEILR